MASKRTDNLNLHAWERTDAFMMDEFNENFDAIDKAVAAKAEQTALDAETAARTALAAQVAAKAEQSALDALSGRVDKKAEQTALDAETAAREAALAALTGQVGELDAGRLRFKFDSYKGTGKIGENSKNRLTFDFKPLVLIVGCTSAYTNYGGYPWVRNMTYGKTNESYSVALTWEEKAVSWYHTATTERQLNVSNCEYYYIAIGIKE